MGLNNCYTGLSLLSFKQLLVALNYFKHNKLT